MCSSVHSALYTGNPRVYILSMHSPETIREITDPAERVTAASQAIEQLRELMSEYAAITRDTVREMRQTMSYGEVARALSVSRSRVQQLESGRSGGTHGTRQRA
jgi:predicted transcriptional regulator